MAEPHISDTLIVIRGGGDLATGVAQKLWHAGFKLIMLETAQPMMIRRPVCLGSAIADGQITVEDVTGVKTLAENVQKVWKKSEIPVIVNPSGDIIHMLKPAVVVDAILAKKNLGTNRQMAPLTIALGPGFSAPEDVDAVIETMRGHNLGRIITKGKPLANTGIPGVIAGKSKERVIYAPAAGLMRHRREIGAQVQQGETLFYLGDTAVPSPLTGTLRGLIAEGTLVSLGLKIADVDPRPNVPCDQISDKARAIGGGVLDAVLMLGHKKGLFV
ncbi:selenium-dependent molybdenum hydroxylase system protein [Agrilactobacillus composti DSM 18527 = JCM 14202]|jgi:xanthine dehydrogenase accessory factor|uniref:Selenium-dependent molybdenum hydroxylase system protein n=1 Tax=Agrilactobacillus composti DSM 18527 = JCM 14202 TaxID=1423734 RepID=X0PCP1_9LACO|nr:selenium-dependent molybdenum cofactor biosynthesis protein YqeB [Agrilactobacillus composti]KRM30616.1 selenium-dependent molybdenum hydroxylase system protein [Agrilactobacillus composti DSM 18527 = JCM 14202]MCH4170712.1 EF2563 family selenium-dependent molybdenum hydroxylase system protein [Lactobacillus sp.]GAF38298.1 xanthine and CO dehydrogenases maturation factor, XdhC/CoxF family [Agrilactobacillus composti DSM 18527 = JCM 14202]